MHNTLINTLKESIMAIGQALYQRHCLTATDGNISVKLPDNNILITQRGTHKAHLRVSDFALIRQDGTVIEGNPSSELAMHLMVYQQCQTARCVIHAHPPHAIAWSIAHPKASELPRNILPEAILATGLIPIVPYARTGTTALAEQIKPYLNKYKLMILSYHGALCWGENSDEALWGIERLEHICHILTITQQLGGAHPLADEECDALWRMRDAIGMQCL